MQKDQSKKSYKPQDDSLENGCNGMLMVNNSNSKIWCRCLVNLGRGNTNSPKFLPLTYTPHLWFHSFFHLERFAFSTVGLAAFVQRSYNNCQINLSSSFQAYSTSQAYCSSLYSLHDWYSTCMINDACHTHF